MVDKILRWRIKYNAGGQNIPQADKILRRRVKFFPRAVVPTKKSFFTQSLTVPKMSHSAENVAQCRKTLYPTLKHYRSYSLSLSTSLYIDNHSAQPIRIQHDPSRQPRVYSHTTTPGVEDPSRLSARVGSL